MATPVGSVVARLIRAGYPEATARRIASGELSMDAANKMARMQEQGFEGGYFKGMYPYDWTKETATSPGPEITEISRKTPFPSFGGDDGDVSGVAGFITRDPEVASRFAGRSGAVYPLAYRAGRTLEIDAKGKPAGSVQFGDEGKPFRDAIRSGQYDTVLISNTSDEGDVIVSLRPENIRSQFAAFDPEQTGSSNILAGLGGAGVVGAGLMASDEVSASPLDDPERAERRANLRAVQVASDTLERLRRERGAVMSPLQDTRMARFGDYLTENRPSEMDPVQRALQSLGLFQGLGEYLRTTGEGQRTTTMQDINAALDVVPL